MKVRYPAAAMMSLALLAGCSGNSNSPTAGGTTGPAGGSASAAVSVPASASPAPTASASLRLSCQQLEATVRDIPNRLQLAATSGTPVTDVPRAVQDIQRELTADVSGGDGELRAAVQRYTDALQQAARNVSNGKLPDFSTINPSRIEDLCSAGGASAGGSPTATAP